MIHHISISARAPQHVAEVLAELMNGNVIPFGPLEVRCTCDALRAQAYRGLKL